MNTPDTEEKEYNYPSIEHNGEQWIRVVDHIAFVERELQKAREEERKRIKRLIMILGTKNMANGAGIYKMLYPNEIIDAINHSELDQDIANEDNLK